MGNTVSSASSTHSVPNPRRAHQRTKGTGGGLRRLGSNATLARLYHHNLSSNTLSSKAIAWKNQHGERILDIGKPTKFEHGIHVEFDDNSGKFMGLPDVWQGNFPSDDILDTAFIHPSLVPTSDPLQSGISKPFRFQHNIHVQLDVDGVGYTGLPLEWQQLLEEQGCLYKPAIKIQQGEEPTKKPLTKRESRQLNLSQTRKSFLKAPTMKAVEALHQEEEEEEEEEKEEEKKENDIHHHQHDDGIKNNSNGDSIDNHTATDPNNLYSNFILVGEGESGPLFAAKHILTGRVVAIKKIPKTAIEKIQKIKNELITMKMSRHPNVVEYITSYITKHEIWVVMEFMDMALADILSLETEQDGACIRLQETLIARISRDVLRALSRIHRLNRIHRDIRSDNILLNLRGDVKLTDFSHCAQLTQNQPKRKSVIGTPYWMAPELIKGTDYDTKVDIWSLGALVVEMAQNNPPYIEYPSLRALYLIASQGLPDLEEPDRWSENFKDFLKQCTTMDPNERPDAATLLKHPFITSAVGTTEDVVGMIKKAREIEIAQQLADEEEEQAIEEELSIGHI